MDRVNWKGAARPTAAQIERRRDKLVEWRMEGYAMDQIGRSMRPPVHLATLTKDAATRRRQLSSAPGAVRNSSRRPRDPEPYDWMSGPPPPPPQPGYVLRSPLRRMEALRDYLRESDARNVFAFNVDEAERLRDGEFLEGSQLVIADLIERLQELQDIAL